MTTKPDDFQQKAILVGLDSSAIPSDVVMVNGCPYYSNVYTARAILKAKNDAYEEAAKAADGYRHKEAGFRSNEPDKSVYGWGTARREISQAIRNLKHETEV